MYLDFDMSSNKYFIGFIMIIINIGSRFLLDELTPSQKKFINKPLIRRIVIFCIFYMATKDLMVSVTLTIIFIIFISDMFIKDKDERDIEKKENNKRERILNEIEIVLSKYSE